MRESLQLRLKELEGELESGQARLAELAAEQTRVRETVLRIAGAVQVLQEELDKAAEETAGLD